MLMPFNKLKCTVQRLFEHRQVYRSSVLLGLIVTGNFSLKLGAKELVGASPFPMSWKLRSEQAPPVPWVMLPAAPCPVPVYSELALGLLIAHLPLCHRSASRTGLQKKCLQNSLGYLFWVCTLGKLYNKA